MLRFTHIPHEFESNAIDSSHVKKFTSSLCRINRIDMSLEKHFFLVSYGTQTQLIIHKRIALFRHFVVKSLSMLHTLLATFSLRFFVSLHKKEASPSFVRRAYAYHSVDIRCPRGSTSPKPFITANAGSV